jgi:hypothetical protein
MVVVDTRTNDTLFLAIFNVYCVRHDTQITLTNCGDNIDSGLSAECLSINVWFLNRLHSLFKTIRTDTLNSAYEYSILDFLSYIDQFCSISAIYSISPISHEQERERTKLMVAAYSRRI